MLKDLLKNNPSVPTTIIALFDRMGAKLVATIVTNGFLGYLIYGGFFSTTATKIAAVAAMVIVFAVFAIFRDKEDGRAACVCDECELETVEDE